jgi:putative iron-regulated protein
MKKYLLLLVLCFVAIGCDDDVSDNGVTDGQRESMLRALATNVITPGFAEVGNSSLVLDNAVDAFIQAPNATTLTTARQAWITLAKNWKRMEIYQQGLLDPDDDSLIYKIDLGAADFTQRATLIPQMQLESAINAFDGTPNAAYVERLPALLQGIPAIEDLLFNESNGSVLEKFTTASNAEKRKNFFEGLSGSLLLRLRAVEDSWKVSGSAFQQFVNAYGTDLGSSLGMLMNDVVDLAEQMKNQKIGRPLGYYSAQVPQPDSVEARWSVQSLPFFVENLDAIERAFTSDAEGRTGVGVDSLLNYMDAMVGDHNLSAAVIKQLATMRTLALSLGDDLPNAVRTNRAKVDEVYAECLVLLKLLKVDVVTQLGVMITSIPLDGD